jgi:hypothetical protein
MNQIDGAGILDGLKLYEKNYQLREKIGELMDAWKMAYPGINIKKQILAAHAWEMSNPDKRKIHKARFLNNWMKTAQEWAESSPTYSEPLKPVKDLPPAPDMTPNELDDMHRQTVKALGPQMCKIVECKVCGK